MKVGVVGDYQPDNETHTGTDAALEHVGAEFEWVPTEAVPGDEEILGRFGALWIAPASPYRNMEGALRAIKLARERGIPLVAT